MESLVRDSDGFCVAQQVVCAHGLISRAIGLLGRTGLPGNFTLWLKPCRAVHTWGMRFPIDVMFVDRDLCITRIVIHLPPWRFAHGGTKADSAFEFSADTPAMSHLMVGDVLTLHRT